MKKILIVALAVLLCTVVVAVPAEAKTSIQKTNESVDIDNSFVAPEKENIELTNPAVIVLKLPNGYSAVFTAHRGFVSGCIKRDVFHVGFLISKAGQSQPVTDLHIAAWRDSGRVCVGIYVSPQGWCTKICSPTYSQIVGGIAAALIATGIAYYVAYAIAYALAPIAVGVLVL